MWFTFYISLENFCPCVSLWVPSTRWKCTRDEWIYDVGLPVTSWNCFVFCLPAKDRWGEPDLRRAGAGQTPPGRQRPPHQHCLRPDPLWGEQVVIWWPLPWSYLMPAIPVIYDTLETKSLFLYFPSCLLRGGEPLSNSVPGAFEEKYEAQVRGSSPQKIRGQRPRMSLPGQDILGLSPEKCGLWFWEYPRRFFCWAIVLHIFFFFLWVLIFGKKNLILIFCSSCICDIKLVAYS